MNYDEQLRDKWMPRFHACFAYVASFFYFGLRQETESFPVELREFYFSTFFKIIFVGVGLLGTVVTGMVILIYLNKKIHGSTISSFIIDFGDYQFRYYRPYLFTIMFVALLESVIFVLN